MPPGKKFALACALLLLVLFGFEIFLQGLCAISPKIWYKLHPWVKQQRYIPDDKLRRRGDPDLPEHDRLGYRNPSVPESAELVCLGDSFTYGHQCAPEEAWPITVQRLTGLSAYNMGISGTGPAEYFHRLSSQGFELSPKTVLVGVYFGNDFLDAYNAGYMWKSIPDFLDPDFVEPEKVDELEGVQSLYDEIQPELNRSWAKKRRQSPLRSLIKTGSEYSQIFAMLRAGYLVVTKRQRLNDDGRWLSWEAHVAKHPGGFVLYDRVGVRTVLAPVTASVVDLDDPRVMEGLRITGAVFQRMDELCRSKSARMMIVLLPTKEFVFSELLPQEGLEKLARSKRNEDAIRRRFVELMDQHNIEVIDTVSAQRAAIRSGLNPYFESDNMHLSPLGQQIVAKEIAKRLAEQAP